jgi:hypothetical protein
MSQLIGLIDQLSQAGLTTLLIALAASAGFVAVIRNWRLTLPIMIIQYVLVGIFLARAIDPSVALIKPLAGAIVCFALSIAAQRADFQRSLRGESIARERLERPDWQRLPAQVMLRALATMLVLTAAFGATLQFPLPGNARELSFGAAMLIGCGLLIIATASEALNTGLGMLMFISGFELAYTPLEPAIGVSVLIGLVTLLVGLSIAYLTLADGTKVEPVPAMASIDVENEATNEDDVTDADLAEQDDDAEEAQPAPELNPNSAQVTWLTNKDA